MPLLSKSVKTIKTEKNAKILVLAQYFSPEDYFPEYFKIRKNFCGSADGCAGPCLGVESGHYGMGDKITPTVTQMAMIRRKQSFIADPTGHLLKLCEEIEKGLETAKKKALQLAIRLNATADVLWENYYFSYKGKIGNIFDHFQNVQFYDYTAHKLQNRKKALKIANYHLTYSLKNGSERQWARAMEYLAENRPVAVAFATKKKERLPKTFRGLPVTEGDSRDDRFNDLGGTIVGLTAKGNRLRESELRMISGPDGFFQPVPLDQ